MPRIFCFKFWWPYFHLFWNLLLFLSISYFHGDHLGRFQKIREQHWYSEEKKQGSHRTLAQAPGKSWPALSLLSLLINEAFAHTDDFFLPNEKMLPMGTSHMVAGIFNVFSICLLDHMINCEAAQLSHKLLLRLFPHLWSHQPLLQGHPWLSLWGLIPNAKADTFII